MIILGHKNIPSEKIYGIKSREDIAGTIPNSSIMFEYNLELMQYANTNKISYGVYINSITQAIFANALGAKYIFVMENHASQIQSIANEYMFDAKVIQIIANEKAIEKVALNGIDGIIFESTIGEIL